MRGYYQTPGGHFYKILDDGRKVRVSQSEGQVGGASKKSSPKKSSPKKAPKNQDLKYTPMELQCLEWVKQKMDDNNTIIFFYYYAVSRLSCSDIE